MVTRHMNLRWLWGRIKCMAAQSVPCKGYATRSGALWKKQTARPFKCPMCDRIVVKTGRFQKVCAACRSAKDLRRKLKRLAETGKIKNPGVGSGNGVGKGPQHHSYKTGEHACRNYLKLVCETCGSKKYLDIHHDDENRSNNEPSNLKTLCRSCHITLHHARRKDKVNGLD